MSYDVHHRPGRWVTLQANRRARRVWLLIVLLFALGLASLGLLRWNPASIALSVLIIVLAVALGRRANCELDDASRWLWGARAETSVGEELNRLRGDGYVVLHDIEQRGEGNIDHVVSGPTGVFLVETKLRRYDETHLVKVKRQALRLHTELATWITPVICLHTRTGRAFRTEGVWIVPQPALLEWIRAERNAVADAERLAAFMASLLGETSRSTKRLRVERRRARP
jgi:hypothetical protein